MSELSVHLKICLYIFPNFFGQKITHFQLVTIRTAISHPAIFVLGNTSQTHFRLPKLLPFPLTEK